VWIEIGESWSFPQSRGFAELLIECEEDRTLRAVLVGMLRGLLIATLGDRPHTGGTFGPLGRSIEVTQFDWRLMTRR
jgi:hypothetical protein